MITVAFSFQGPMWSYGATNGGVVSAEKVDLMVSLSDDTKDAEVSIPVRGLDKAALEQAITDNNVTLSLTRDKSKKYLDADMFPHQKDGGELSTWKTQNDTPLFDVVGMEADESNGKISLKVTIDSHCYFYSRGKVDYSAPHTGGGAYLDICGYFNLTANVDGSSIGNVSAKVTPYPSFHTMDEVYADIDAMAAYDTDRYVEKASMSPATKTIVP